MEEKKKKRATPLWKVYGSLRGIAIVAVLVAHAALFALQTQDVALEQKLVSFFPSLPLAYLDPVWITFSSLAGFCVPTFLFLAGHALSTSNQSWKAAWGRIRKLLVPFLFWSFFAWAWSWKGGAEWGWSVWEFLERLVTGRALIGYFFFLLIFQWYAIAPIVVPFVKKRPGLALSIAGVITLGCTTYDYITLYLHPASTTTGNVPSTTFFFTRVLLPLLAFFPVLGMVAGSHSKSFKKVLSMPRLFWVGTVVCCVLLMVEVGAVFHYLNYVRGFDLHFSQHFSQAEWKLSYQLWALVATIGLICLWMRRIPTSKIYQLINKESYALYLLNGPSLLFAHYVFRKAGLYEMSGFVAFPLVLAIELAGPLVIVSLVRKYAPKVAPVILG